MGRECRGELAVNHTVGLAPAIELLFPFTQAQDRSSSAKGQCAFAAFLEGQMLQLAAVRPPYRHRQRVGLDVETQASSC